MPTLYVTPERDCWLLSGAGLCLRYLDADHAVSYALHRLRGIGGTVWLCPRRGIPFAERVEVQEGGNALGVCQRV